MALPTFNPPIAPSPGTVNKPDIRIRSTEFGDGYTRDAPDGINHIRDVLDLTWDLLTPAQCSAIHAFFMERGGYKAFMYRSALDAAPKKWTCKEFSPSVVKEGFQSYRAQFKVCFNPGE